MALGSFNSIGVPKLLDLFHFIPMWAPNRSGYHHQQLRLFDGNSEPIFTWHFSHRLIPPRIKRIVVLLSTKHRQNITSVTAEKLAKTRLLDAFHRRRAAMKRIMLCLGCPKKRGRMESRKELVERNIENVEKTGH